MLEPARLSHVAVDQLAAWEELAGNWASYADGPVRRCASCHIAILRTHDGSGAEYVYTDGQWLALTVAHLRQAHMDLDPDRG